MNHQATADREAAQAAADAFFAEANAYHAHLGKVQESFTDDVLRLYEAAREGTGASEVCRQILRIIHAKSGLIDPTEMFRLDTKNKKAALRLLELAANPSELSDDGLSEILTAAQLDALFTD